MDNINGKVITHYRKERGLSIRELARLSDVSENTISALERGKKNSATVRIVIKLANALGVNLTDFQGLLKVEIVRD